MKSETKRNLKYYIPLTVALILILTFGIIEKQSFIKLLPALISLAVNLFTAKVNRIAFLIGAVNCFIYSIGYFQAGLYGSVASALLYSMPLQVVSYFTWRKNSYKSSRIIKTFKLRGRIFSCVALVVLSVICAWLISNLDGSNQALLDGTVFIFGLFATVYIMLGYIEGVIINVISITISVIMWLSIVFSGNTADLTYAFLNIYTLYMTVISLVNWIKLYKKQNKEQEEL